MSISIIVACSRNGVIGKDNGLPWHLPEDLKHFKATTMGKPMVMGRKTFESIGRPLPGRTTLVVTRQQDWQADGVFVCHSVQEALQRAEGFLSSQSDEIMVVGGEDVYRQCLALADNVYQTRVDMDVEGDAFFPPLDDADWRICAQSSGCSEASGIHFSFVHLQRVVAQ